MHTNLVMSLLMLLVSTTLIGAEVSQSTLNDDDSLSNFIKSINYTRDVVKVVKMKMNVNLEHFTNLRGMIDNINFMEITADDREDLLENLSSTLTNANKLYNDMLRYASLASSWNGLRYFFLKNLSCDSNVSLLEIDFEIWKNLSNLTSATNSSSTRLKTTLREANNTISALDPVMALFERSEAKLRAFCAKQRRKIKEAINYACAQVREYDNCWVSCSDEKAAGESAKERVRELKKVKDRLNQYLEKSRMHRETFIKDSNDLNERLKEIDITLIHDDFLSEENINKLVQDFLKSYNDKINLVQLCNNINNFMDQFNKSSAFLRDEIPNYPISNFRFQLSSINVINLNQLLNLEKVEKLFDKTNQIVVEESSSFSFIIIILIITAIVVVTFFFVYRKNATRSKSTLETERHVTERPREFYD